MKEISPLIVNLSSHSSNHSLIQSLIHALVHTSSMHPAMAGPLTHSLTLLVCSSILRVHSHTSDEWLCECIHHIHTQTLSQHAGIHTHAHTYRQCVRACMALALSMESDTHSSEWVGATLSPLVHELTSTATTAPHAPTPSHSHNIETLCFALKTITHFRDEPSTHAHAHAQPYTPTHTQSRACLLIHSFWEHLTSIIRMWSASVEVNGWVWGCMSVLIQSAGSVGVAHYASSHYLPTLREFTQGMHSTDATTLE